MSSSNDTNRIEVGNLLIETNAAGEIEIHNLADNESVTLGANGLSASAVNTGELSSETKPWADVTAYGAVGDGTTDDTQAFQDALSAAKRVYVPHSDSGYLITAALDVGENQVLEGESTSTAIHYDGSSDTANSAIRIDYKGMVRDLHITSTRSAWDVSSPWTGIEVVGSTADAHDSGIQHVDISDFEYGLHLNAADYPIAYAKYDPRRIYDCVEGIRIENGNSWTNECTFITPRISISSGRHTEADNLSQSTYGIRMVPNSQYRQNNHKFVGPCIEHTGIGIDISGMYNTLVSPRCENIRGTDNYGIVFRSTADFDARYNFVLGQFGEAGAGTSARTVTLDPDGTERDDNYGNRVIGRDIPQTTGTINLHNAGYRNIQVGYDDATELVEFSRLGITRADLDMTTGDLTIDGTATSNGISTNTINGGGPVSDGDGTERNIWVIPAGGSDPADATANDIIFEELP